MTLSKKHFIAIADLIKKWDVIRSNGLFVAELMYYFESQNPNFDNQKFKDACLKDDQKHEGVVE